MKQQKGFTLIEISIVLIIVGLMVAGASSGLVSYLNQERQNITKDRLQAIQEALDNYYQVNGRYPCPASYRARVDVDANFARISDPTCDTAIAGPGSVGFGTIRVAGRANLCVRIGTIPTRNLNLSDEYMFDKWNNRLTYAVTEQLAGSRFPSRACNGANVVSGADLGAINVVDSGGNTLLNTAGTAHYIVLSHGSDLEGYGFNGNNPSGGCSNNAGNLDRFNCDHIASATPDATFIKTLLSSQNNGNQYDDIVFYKGESSAISTIPQGAVIAVNTAACPNGWVPYAAAAGRTIIGTGNYNETATSGTTQAGGGDITPRQNWNYSFNYNTVGMTGGFAKYRLSQLEIPALTNQRIDVVQPNPTATTTVSGFVFGTGAGYSPAPTTFRLQRPRDAGGAVIPQEDLDNRMPYVALTYCQKL
jgi:prepilin-type N-terminal cleavage/methylation domain-containing protein